MPSGNPVINKLGAQIGGTARRRPDDPRLVELRRELAIARFEARIAAAVESAPTPLPESVAARWAERIQAAGKPVAA